MEGAIGRRVSEREAILSRIRASLGRGPLGHDRLRELEDRLVHHRANVVPARGQLDAPGRLQLFQQSVSSRGLTVARLRSIEDVPAEVERYLAEGGLPMTLKVAPKLSHLGWAERGRLICAFGPGTQDDLVAANCALCAVAESGAIVLTSSQGTPVTLNFVPATHFVVLDAADVVGTLEEVWARIRAMHGAGSMPRTVNFVSNVSFSGDIERLVRGAHGPLRLHLLILGG